MANKRSTEKKRSASAVAEGGARRFRIATSIVWILEAIAIILYHTFLPKTSTIGFAFENLFLEILRSTSKITEATNLV